MAKYSKQLKNNLQISTLLAALLLLPLSTAPSFITSAQAEDKLIPKMHVTGEGKIDLAPDLAILNLGVMREAKTARGALSANNSAMAEVIAAMKDEGIEPRDLQTSNFSIQPRYVYHRPKDGEQQKPPKIVGYTVSNNLTVRIRDLKSIGEILDTSVTLGVNSGGHIQFGNDDPKPAITKARTAAMKDAMQRAGTLTSAAGVSLGRILEINESFNRPHPVPMARGKMMAEAAMSDSVPIEGGENT